jgi:two-component system, cell cycle response regulator
MLFYPFSHDRRYISAMGLQTTPHFDASIHRPAADAPACMVVLYGGELGRRTELPQHGITIGRDDDNAIHVELHTMSRRHARLFVADGKHHIEDLGSTNGTFVNEQELSCPTQLRNGDLVRCGGAVFKFIDGGNVEALYHEEIYRLTITDGLTQVANKRHFVDFLEREIVRAARHGRPLSLVIFDVDHFKLLNDEFGHLAGDRVLQGLAALVNKEVRRDELLARYGGEEFAVVLPETSVDSAALFCERIRADIESATFDYDDEPLHVTISLGATALEPTDTLETLVARADANQYKAKEAGRNRVVAGILA